MLVNSPGINAVLPPAAWGWPGGNFPGERREPAQLEPYNWQALAELARAVIFQAARDAVSVDPEKAAAARAWLLEDGPIWAEALGVKCDRQALARWMATGGAESEPIDLLERREP